MGSVPSGSNGTDDGGGVGSAELQWVGIVIAIVSSLAASLGDTYMKKSHNIWKDVDPRPPVYKRKYWMLASFLIIIINTAGSIGAVAFAPSYVVLPFCGLHIVFNVFLANFIADEEVTRSQALLSIVVTIGVILTVVAAPEEDTDYTRNDIDTFSTNPGGLCFLILSFLAIFSFVVILALPRVDTTWKKWAIVLLVGILGGLNNVLMKSVISMVLHGTWENTWRFATPWVFTCIKIVSAVSQFLALNAALKRHDAIFVVPVANSLLVCWGSWGSIVFFQSYKAMDTSEAILAGVGIALVVVGVLPMAFKLTNDPIWLHTKEEKKPLIKLYSTDMLESQDKEPLLHARLRGRDLSGMSAASVTGSVIEI